MSYALGTEACQGLVCLAACFPLNTLPCSLRCCHCRLRMLPTRGSIHIRNGRLPLTELRRAHTHNAHTMHTRNATPSSPIAHNTHTPHIDNTHAHAHLTHHTQHKQHTTPTQHPQHTHTRLSFSSPTPKLWMSCHDCACGGCVSAGTKAQRHSPAAPLQAMVKTAVACVPACSVSVNGTSFPPTALMMYP